MVSPYPPWAPSNPVPTLYPDWWLQKHNSDHVILLLKLFQWLPSPLKVQAELSVLSPALSCTLFPVSQCYTGFLLISILFAFSHHAAFAHADLSPGDTLSLSFYLVDACPLPFSDLTSSITSQRSLPWPPWLFQILLSVFFSCVVIWPCDEFCICL